MDIPPAMIVASRMIGKVLGILNWHTSPIRFSRQYWTNISYRILLLIYHSFMFAQQAPVQKKVFEISSPIPRGKLMLEVILYWGCFYVTLISMGWQGSRVDNIVKKIGKLGRKGIPYRGILSWHMVLYICTTSAQLGFYTAAYFLSNDHVSHLKSAVTYYFIRATVLAANVLCTSGLYIIGDHVKQLGVSLQKWRPSGYPLKYALKLYEEKWQDLVVLSAEVNAVFNLHIWFFSTTNIMEVIFSFNHLTSIAKICSGDRKCYVINYIIFILWLLSYLVPDINMIFASSLLTERSKEFGRATVDMEQHGEIDGVTDEIIQFSTEIHQQPIKISACACFELNFKLVASKVSSIATYLLILTQFQKDGVETAYTGFL